MRKLTRRKLTRRKQTRRKQTNKKKGGGVDLSRNLSVKHTQPYKDLSLPPPPTIMTMTLDSNLDFLPNNDAKIYIKTVNSIYTINNLINIKAGTSITVCKENINQNDQYGNFIKNFMIVSDELENYTYEKLNGKISTIRKPLSTWSDENKCNLPDTGSKGFIIWSSKW